MGICVVMFYKVNFFQGTPVYFDPKSDANAKKAAEELLRLNRQQALVDQENRFSICAAVQDGGNVVWRALRESDPEDTVCQVFDHTTGKHTEVKGKADAYALNKKRQDDFLAHLSLDKIYEVDELPEAYGDDLYTPIVGQEGIDIAWVPTPTHQVSAMLHKLIINSNDVLCDFGSGDGRIAVEAVKRFGIKAVCIEANPDLLELSKRNAALNNVADKITFICGDIKTIDVPDVTIFATYTCNLLVEFMVNKFKQSERAKQMISYQFNSDSFPATEVDGNIYYWVKG